jgi:hypothetical protein
MEPTMESDKGGYRQINKSLNICVFQEYLDSQTARLPELPDVEQVTPRVLRILGQNPGKVRGTTHGRFKPEPTCEHPLTLKIVYLPRHQYVSDRDGS